VLEYVRTANRNVAQSSHDIMKAAKISEQLSSQAREQNIVGDKFKSIYSEFLRHQIEDSDAREGGGGEE
jgi:hypothetical protein